MEFSEYLQWDRMAPFLHHPVCVWASIIMEFISFVIRHTYITQHSSGSDCVLHCRQGLFQLLYDKLDNNILAVHHLYHCQNKRTQQQLRMVLLTTLHVWQASKRQQSEKKMQARLVTTDNVCSSPNFPRLWISDGAAIWSEKNTFAKDKINVLTLSYVGDVQWTLVYLVTLLESDKKFNFR